jgi:hypothetical protein
MVCTARRRAWVVPSGVEGELPAAAVDARVVVAEKDEVL